nr:hypothetical protein [Lelliottia steviae]
MAVNKIYSFWLVIFLVLMPTTSFAENEAVLKLLEEDVKRKIVLLSDKISECKEIANSSSLKLNTKAFEKLNIDRNAFLKSLFYLNVRNRNLCENSLRQSLAFAIGQLDFTRNELGLGISDYSKSSFELLYESSELLKIRVHYEMQSKAFKNELEKQIGTSPFDFSLVTKMLDSY